MVQIVSIFPVDNEPMFCHTMYDFKRCPLRISDFEWDEGNVLHLQLHHGIEPEEVEEVFAVAPLIRRTKKGHYAAFGPTLGGRYLTIVFEHKTKGRVRPFTGWDMSQAEVRYYRKNRG